MKKQDLSVLKAIILKEMEGSSTCNECGGPMYEGMCTECGYTEKNVNSAKGKHVDDAIDASFLKMLKNIYPEKTPQQLAAMIQDMRARLGPTKSPSMTEDHQGTDHEVSMANNSIDSILWAANELKKHLQGGERDIPAWIQDHITNAENYILQAAKNYHEYGSQEDDFSDMDAADYEEEMDEMSLNSLMEAKKKPSAGLTKKQKSTVAKKARAGKDVGKKGKGFEKVAKKAAKKYGSAERGRKVAAAAMWKSVKRK